MKHIVTCILAVALLSGCGYNPKDPVYDTANNPQGFPRAAVRLLDRIEDGTLKTLDDISEAFGDLYTEHSELLDNEQWKELIDRLGRRLNYRAEQILNRGVTQYKAAADYFTLASFARPTDTKIAERAALFGSWRDYMLGERAVPLDSAMNLETKIRVLKHFLFGDTLDVRFANEWLIGKFVKPSEIAAAELRHLPVHDRAFLAWAGFSGADPDTTLVKFENPRVDLVAVHFTEIEPNVRRAEIYFRPHEPLTADYSVLLRISTVDTTLQTPSSELDFVPFEVVPSRPASTWPVGKITGVGNEIQFMGPFSQVSIALVDTGKDPRQFAQPVGIEGRYAKLGVK
jgi:hypothetical protein